MKVGSFPRAPCESVPELGEESAHPAGPFPASFGLESDLPLGIESSRAGRAFLGMVVKGEFLGAEALQIF